MRQMMGTYRATCIREVALRKASRGFDDDTVVESRTGVSSVVIVYPKRASLAPVTGESQRGRLTRSACEDQPSAVGDDKMGKNEKVFLYHGETNITSLS
jgi:hypothetical protein